MENDINPVQLRAARALIGWSRGALAEAAGTTERTIARIEDGDTAPRQSTVAAIQSALEAAGVDFIPAGRYQGDGGAGVRLRNGVAQLPVSV